MITDILDWDNLCAAWENVYLGGAGPGSDGITIARWRRTWEERLVGLRADVLANRYLPSPLSWYTMPKPSGGTRQIACPTVTDKVLQRAVLNVLDRTIDPIFLSCSFGYRKGSSAPDAVAAVCRQRDQGRRWVLDADIDECFDSMDHAIILKLLRRQTTDPIVTRLVRLWLQWGTRVRGATKGIALGAVISPLLCNLVLHELDCDLTSHGLHMVRYADDFVVLCETAKAVQGAQDLADAALERLALQLEPAKTAITTFEQGFDYLGVHFEGDTLSIVRQGEVITVAYPPFGFHYDYGADRYYG